MGAVAEAEETIVSELTSDDAEARSAYFCHIDVEREIHDDASPGCISWYRNIDRNVAEHPEVGTRPLELPCLMLTAEWDPGLRPEFTEPMRALCSDLELQRVEKVGQRVQREAPKVVNGYLLTWLRRFGR